jgi:aspartate carbamoyltransferase catalytic subunit
MWVYIPFKMATRTANTRQSASDTTGAKHPSLDDDEKSKKGEGVAETAKIHGTVDSARPVGGQKGSDKSKEAGETDTKED